MALLIIIAVLWFVGWLLFREKKEDRLVREAREKAEKQTAGVKRETDAAIEAAKKAEAAARQAERDTEFEAYKKARAEKEAHDEALKAEALKIRNTLKGTDTKHEFDKEMLDIGIRAVKRPRGYYNLKKAPWPRPDQESQYISRCYRYVGYANKRTYYVYKDYKWNGGWEVWTDKRSVGRLAFSAKTLASISRQLEGTK